VTPVELEIDGWAPPVKLGGNSRLHWAAKHKLIRQVKHLVLLEAIAADFPVHAPGDPRRRLTITTRRPRRLDADNEAMACKGVVDGLRAAGALRGDSLRHLELAIVQEIGPERTRLRLEDVTEGE
jgi:hypothetical protein